MMIPSDSSSKTNATAASEALPLEQSGADVAPPIGITPPQILAQDAATGRRGAAWRLMVWIVESDPRAVIAVSSRGNSDQGARVVLHDPDHQSPCSATPASGGILCQYLWRGYAYRWSNIST